MIIYTDENDVRLVQSVASASTMISSITGEIREYILSKFPRNFFRSIYLDTAETVHAQGRNDKYNKTLNKLPFPNMSITPEISLDSPIQGMEKSQALNSPNLFLRKDLKSFYKKILLDPQKKYSVYYTSDYLTTNFNFKITTNKFVQNADLVHFIKSRFQQGFFQFLNDRYVNTEIPKTYVKIIADILGLNPDDPEDMTELELYFISTGTSDDIVRKKINLMTGKVGFFVNEKSNFLTLLEGIEAPGSIIREQMSEGEYVITFKVQVSAWVPNSFILSMDKNRFLQLDQTTIDTSLSNSATEQDEGFYSLGLNNVLMNRKDSITAQLSGGESGIFQETYNMVFTYDVATSASVIDLTDYMRPDLKQIHAYMMSKNMVISDLMRVTMFNRQGQLTNSDVVVDYENLLVTVQLSSAQDLSLSIYVNRLLFEAIKKAMERDEFFFSENALATIVVNIDGEGLRVPVYSFENLRDMFTTDPNKILRVNTIYGIGYVGLVDDDPTTTADDKYKICIGYNGEDPIIKCLQTL